ncbi:hypothetical protein SAMN04488126_107100 [Bhargavaea beijingensis]|uniref:Uncharacterized protein n=1 Tax=Bhargavaea beijingensis TaxID=426756 RepID=A0A1G7C9R2_9BACL|nr:hypothetical protein SAMN04488126_107100 [Bhargavaea beijingensis]
MVELITLPWSKLLPCPQPEPLLAALALEEKAVARLSAAEIEELSREKKSMGKAISQILPKQSSPAWLQSALLVLYTHISTKC